MKERPLTPEEKKLWRESNKHTETRNVARPRPLGDSDNGEAGSGGKPSPLGGEGLDEGTSRLAPALPNSAPPQPSPYGGGPLPLRGSALSPLRPLPAREARRVFKPYGAVEATLDLHGLTKLAAHARVGEFIAAQHQRGRRHVAIITGKGKGGEVGVLRSNLPHWLNEAALRPLISAFAYARPEKGGAGVTHVLVKKG